METLKIRIINRIEEIEDINILECIYFFILGFFEE